MSINVYPNSLRQTREYNVEFTYFVFIDYNSWKSDSLNQPYFTNVIHYYSYLSKLEKYNFSKILIKIRLRTADLRKSAKQKIQESTRWTTGKRDSLFMSGISQVRNPGRRSCRVKPGYTPQ